MLALQLAHKPLHGGRRCFDLAEIAALAASSAFSDGDGMLCLGGIDTDVDDVILPHGPPSFAGARLGTPEQPPSAQAAKARGGPPLTPRSYSLAWSPPSPGTGLR